MFRIITTNRFEKEVSKCEKRGLSLDLLQEVIKCLERGGILPSMYNSHILSGKLQGYWECHIKSDWLLIWLKNEDQRTITLIGTGTHADLFK